jgi:SAM-dependent methyltransferase
VLDWICPICAHPLLRRGEFCCPACDFVLREDRGVWIGAEGFRPERFGEDRRAHLAEISKSHFWFDARARLLTRILNELPLASHAAALELGCGTGAFLPVLGERFDQVVGVDAYTSSLHAAQFDLIVALDVLEHLDPARFFGEVSRLIRPGGFLLLSVPAFPLLWSAADVRAGHRCRYRKRQLAIELRQAGWALAGTAYYQCALFAAMLFARRVSSHRTERVERAPPAWLGHALGLINRMEVATLGRRAPFGTSLIAWARR